MDCSRIKWMLYSLFTALFIFLSVSEVGLISSVKNKLIAEPYHHFEKYVIVFDGGSTGTRIHIFKFLNSTDGYLILQDEYFEETKPGLSSYADSPKKAALTVKTLLDRAKTLIPNNRWSDTPVSLKATAGLRLLPASQSDEILHEVSDFIKNSPFHCKKNCATVLDGEDEGIFAWFTINFLLGYVENSKDSVAVLDLGGGSTQVTFAPSELNTFASSPSSFIVQRKVHGKTLTLYSHSYLGLGLMSARFSILKLTSKENDERDDTKVLESPCMPRGSKVTWRHGLDKYLVKGHESGVHSFEECQKRALEFVNETVHKPPELPNKEIYAVSYYIDRAVDLGLVGENGGTVTLKQLLDSAVRECSRKAPAKPFLCLDATYIVTLLQHGLGFSSNKEILMVQQVKDIEASWGLGAAFSLLT